MQIFFKKTRSFFAFLFISFGVLGALVFLYFSPVEIPQVSTFSSRSLPLDQGTYRLTQGTGGCPRIVDMNSHCQGFIFNLLTADSSFAAERFCYLKKGNSLREETTSYGKVRTQVVINYTKNILQKRTFVTMIAKNNRSTSLQEDTLIFGKDNGFLWEHSKDGKGYSCLYEKSAI